MASVASRKKSIISTSGLHIDTNANANTLLNKAASQSTSLYQQCSSLKSRLMRIHGFPPYFSLASPQDSRRSTDPVTLLWDLFSLGTPLCYIFDQLPADAGFDKICNSEFDQNKYESNPDRAKKHAIALFAMKIRKEEVMQAIPGCEPFTVTDLWDRNSTDGFVKVINTVTAIVDHLPPDTFENPPPSPPSVSTSNSFDSLADTLISLPATAKESERDHVIKEILDTERKYVQDLEIMQKYSNALSQSNLMDQDTIHLLFPNLNKLLNFQRKFLIRLESTGELPWKDQRWGQLFLENENEFIVYEPYCANYINAMDIMLANELNLVPLDHLIKFKGELPGMLIKPIQRICKYPLLLKELIKACTLDTYPYYEELKSGQEATKRIADKINEAQRRAENEQTVKSLHARINDWKGHHLENFGELLLDDVFVVTKSDFDREYHVFLFEKIILCCKEATVQPLKGGKGANKNSTLLKKQAASLPLTLPGGNGKTQKNTPLLLKGRIFLGNVTQAVSVPAEALSTTGVPPHFPLAVWWKGDDDLEYFTLRCRREDQMRQWEAQINRLIKEVARKRGSERVGSGMSRILSANSLNPPPQPRIPNGSHYSHSTPIPVYSQSSATPMRRRPSTNNNYDEYSSSTSNLYGSGPQGYPQHDGFDMEPDEDDLEDYPPSMAYATSGRGTPIGTRKTPTSLSMPPERELVVGYERQRAQTEGTNGPVLAQWRNGPSTSVISPGGSVRSITPRMNSNLSIGSVMSYTSDTSFGNTTSRPSLRSQFSSNRLRNGYEGPRNGYESSRNGYESSNGFISAPPSNTFYRNPRSPAPSNSNPAVGPAAPPLNRSRSASQPDTYIPLPKAIPPVPIGSPNWSQDDRTLTGVHNNKRGSGSSQSTAGSSDYSPNSSPPITPYGSSESSLGGVVIHHSHGYIDGSIAGLSPPVKVKVHFHEDIFVIQVPRTTEYGDLVEKVGRKIRLCGPRRDDGPLRVKYRDEDGDMVSLGSTEDVQMAFEAYRPGGQVTLFVT